MKKSIALFSLIGLILLSACNSTATEEPEEPIEETQDVEAETKITEDESEEDEDSLSQAEWMEKQNNEEEESNEDEADIKEKLEEVNDVIIDEYGDRVTLKSQNITGHEFEFNGVVYKVNDVKHLEVQSDSEISSRWEDYFNSRVVVEDPGHFDLLQISINITNSNDFDVDLGGIFDVLTSNKDQLSTNDDLYFPQWNPDKDVYKGVTTEGLFLYVLPANSDPIQDVELYLSGMYKDDTATDTFESLDGTYTELIELND
ncbi:hypothetical protein [Shouchella clausii]|uniref:hypothetical protein n=1 Tax=Shouchella clausii TaxID=79880 RepID=UPI000B97C9C5|nr:hypothetical protein [Shouchella clausii]AST97308.1 hypothetical protein BC8716_15640 [Shouchella clausii]MCR1287868.1 hypothetical protein [Shouchella clausii]MCY1106464.1 hypothetical protein [Shouchella clausii]MEB5473214.1 hypothetical protein [Shouchella clausii]QNM43664.1 hypothetical protein DUT88_12505 [Shouchella clausii]